MPHPLRGSKQGHSERYRHHRDIGGAKGTYKNLPFEVQHAHKSFKWFKSFKESGMFTAEARRARFEVQGFKTFKSFNRYAPFKTLKECAVQRSTFRSTRFASA